SLEEPILDQPGVAISDQPDADRVILVVLRAWFQGRGFLRLQAVLERPRLGDDGLAHADDLGAVHAVARRDLLVVFALDQRRARHHQAVPRPLDTGVPGAAVTDDLAVLVQVHVLTHVVN